MNPNWQKGVSGNPKGRPKRKGNAIVKAAIARFLKQRMTVQALNKLFDDLDSKDQVQLLMGLLPYNVSKAETKLNVDFNNMPDDQLYALWSEVTAGVPKELFEPQEQQEGFWGTPTMLSESNRNVLRADSTEVIPEQGEDRKATWNGLE